MHEGYNHEPGAKGGVVTLHACESLRRATVALEPAGTGALKAARSRRGGSIERTSGALKQYEYPICEITKTGLLPPGVINTGEFVHHRAWVGCAGRTPQRAFVFIGCYRSLANWSRASVRASRASRRAQRLRMPLQARATRQRFSLQRCQLSASQVEASAGESGCVRSLGPANEPCSGSAQLQPAKLYLASHRHSRRRAGVQNRPARPLHTALPAKSGRPIF